MVKKYLIRPLPEIFIRNLPRDVSFSEIVRRILPHNILIDKYVKPLPYEELRKLKQLAVACENVSRSEYEEFVGKHLASWCNLFGHPYHKKVLEFYSSYRFLDPTPNHIFLDVAGGIYTYVNTLQCERRIVQDIKLTDDLKSHLGKEIDYLESSAGQLDLPDESIDRISCHHSFEHFQADIDIQFVKEIQRLLRLGGRGCIVPIFIGDKYIELTGEFSFKTKSDPKAKFIMNPTATLPGGKSCGNFARIYDLSAFQERIINNIDHNKFRVALMETHIDNEPVPDMALSCHRGIAGINRPYRALLIEKIRK